MSSLTHIAVIKLSLIIPVKNAQATLLTCLERLQGLRIPHEIIVVDDHSSAGAMAGVSKYADMIIPLEGSTGPGAARNAGAGKACGETLLFIDADVFTSANDIETSYEEFIAGDYFCAVARYRFNPELAFLGRYYNCYMMYKYTGKITTRIFFTSYAMIRKVDFVPFSECLRSLEDAAMGQRLTQDGRQINIFQTMTIIHQKQVNGIGLTRQFFIRARDAVVLAWAVFRAGSRMRDDSVKSNTRLSLLLLPLLLLGSLCSKLAFFLVLPLLLVNLEYFRYIKRFEGYSGLLASVLIYFYTIVCGDIGMAYGLVKVLAHECMAPFEIRKTPLV